VGSPRYLAEQRGGRFKERGDGSVDGLGGNHDCIIDNKKGSSESESE
jgi:hypothetical protein